MLNHLLDIDLLRKEYRKRKMTRDEVIAEIQDMPIPENIKMDAIIRLVRQEHEPSRVLRDIYFALKKAQYVN